MPLSRSVLATFALLTAALVALVGCSSDGGGHAATATVTRTPRATASATPTASPTTTSSATHTPTSTPDDELPAGEDNGAQGLNPFNNPAHVVPVEVCKDELIASDQSLVLRVLPRGPIAPDGSLAFTSGACVYLPPGYAGSNLRYPVLYLLHGGGGDQGDWVTYGGIRSIMDDLIDADPTNAAIVVMPDGRDAQWYDSLDGSIQNQTYVLDYVIPYVDRHFRTIATRGGRAIDGLSNGGYGAMHLAAKAPDRFVAAGGMSSNLAALTFAGLGTPGGIYYYGNLPAALAGNLDGVDLTLDIGTICLTDQMRDNCLAWRFEQIFVPANRDFVNALNQVRGPDDGVLEYRETEGGHSWNWWPLWLRERHLPFLLARLGDPDPGDLPPAPAAPRTGFRYRSIAPQFSVWGYQVIVDRAVREFLDLFDVRPDGLRVQGSGEARIRTAALYVPRSDYTVSGAAVADQHVRADADGHLTFTVDLGPSHQYDQYTKEANALEQAGGYWTVRDILVSEEDAS